MVRITEKDASGRWQVKGIPWEKMQAGQVITEERSQILYGCLCKLKEYEDSGMSPDQAGSLRDEVEGMAAYVCDSLCHYRKELEKQEELDAVCKDCRLGACVTRIFAMVREKG